MKNYNRIMLGKGGSLAEECRQGNYIGASFDINEDLANSLTEFQDFKEKYIPIFLQNNPEKTKVAAGLACGNLFTICKGLNVGDVVLCPNGKGAYYVGEISGDYYYVAGVSLMHRRPITWYEKVINRIDMSEELRHSTGSIGTCCGITKYGNEIESLIGQTISKATVPAPVVVPQTVQKKVYDERSLHKLFCTSLRQRDIYAKTIYHEQSKSKTDQTQKWVHPDIVGVQFVDFKKDCTKALMKVAEPKETIRLYSYEMKRCINSDYELKQYYFQALSNSNWANFGYLVAYEIDDDLMEEMERLNSAFGIGIIKMQAHNADTEILFPAREKELDYRTIDKLCSINEGFELFIKNLAVVVAAGKDYATAAKDSFVKLCDGVFTTNDEIEAYCVERNIPF